MKTKVALAILVAAVLLLLVARLARPPQQTPVNRAPMSMVGEAPSTTSEAPSETTAIQPPQRPNTPQVQPNRASQQSASGSTALLEALARKRGVPLNVLTQELATELSNALSHALSGPVEFYGKAVDENGDPVPGANATIRCLVFPEHQITTNAPTDSNGLFTIGGIQAQALSVVVSKEGYAEIPGTNEHHFAYYGVPKAFQPDPSNPIVFHLRKKQ
jgi:Carboxypeptidase regulatory-like domain